MEQFTHSETSWLSTRGALLGIAPSDRGIAKEDIGSYFDSGKEKYGMINPNDIKEYARTMFQQI